MSFRKWWFVFAAVVAVAALGAQTSGAGTLSSNVSGDGKVTAGEVRALILKVGEMNKTGKRIDPKVAWMAISEIHANSVSCEKDTDWYRFTAYPGRSGGMMCNGERRWHQTRKWGPPYFGWPMRHILDYIIVEGNLEPLGPGQVKNIRSNGKVATLTFKVFADGKYSGLDKILRIDGSEVTVSAPQ